MTSCEISDGYGEIDETERVLVEEEEFFIRNARHALVSRMGKSFPEGLEDDAVQEARIAAWRSLQEHGNRAYMNIAVKRRLIEHVMRDRWFGMTRSAHEMDPIRRTNRDSFDDPDFEAGLLLVAESLLEQTVLAYHYGEIAAAINTLTDDQREYVVLRFWCGMTSTEIAAAQSKSESNVRTAWSRYIRPHLMRELAHLGAS